MLFLLLLFAIEAHFKTSLRVSSGFFAWDDLPKAKLVQNVYKAKFETDLCFELDHKTHYCSVADEMVAVNAADFGSKSHFTIGDVVLAGKILFGEDVKQILDEMNDSQRAYIVHDAHRQGYDLKMLFQTEKFKELSLTLEIVCHGEFAGKLFPRPDSDAIAENEIFIKVGKYSPFCKKREKVPTGGECQTGHKVPHCLATAFQIPFGFGVACENPLDTCIRTNGSQDSGRGICARETEGLGCGNVCPMDEYCAMTNSVDVARDKYVPKTASEIAWPGISFTNMVTVICPFNGNVEELSMMHRGPYRRYDTPFCTCKKRLVEGSQCQYSFDTNGKYSLNSVVVSMASLDHMGLEQGIDVGCAENLVCKKQLKDLHGYEIKYERDFGMNLNRYEKYGNCVPRDQN